jgi:hypothetical protein
MQTDPVGYKDGLNWYEYTHNDPVNHSDSTGNDAEGEGEGSDASCGSCHTTAAPLADAIVNEGLRVFSPFGEATPVVRPFNGPTTSESRGPTPATPVPGAQGEHSVPRPPITNPDGTPNREPRKGYTTFEPNSQNPSGHQEKSRTDLTGRPHINKDTGQPVPTPHVTGKEPDGTPIPGGVRPARPDELPDPNTRTL